MARYSAEHKQRTRERILATAARRFRGGGLDGSGVASVMGDAGLTNGAFYAHFASKDALAAEVVAEQLARQAELFEKASERSDGLDRVIDAYLSPRHRDDRADGCVSAALIGEIVHAPEEVRAAYAAGLPRVAAAFRRLARMDDDVPDAYILARIAALIGTLQLARAIDDPEESGAVLDEGRRSMRALFAMTAGRS